MFPDDGRSICQKVASFNIIAHDVINLLYGIMNSEQTKIFLHINFVHPVSQSFFQSICKCHIYFTIPVLREYKFFSHNNFSCILIKHFKCLIKAVKWHNKLCSFSDQIFNLTRPKFASRHRLHFLQNLPRWKKKGQKIRKWQIYLTDNIYSGPTLFIFLPKFPHLIIHVNPLTLFRIGLFETAHGWGGRGTKRPTLLKTCYTSHNDGTCHSYTISEENPENVNFMTHTLSSADITRK